MMSNLKRKEIFILLLCLIIGFALRFYSFDQKSLWGDEIYTFNDSRYNIKEQINFYQEEPTYLHPPLFFILTHQFYPFTKPERDLRIIPLIFGTLSIGMFYLLARQFSPSIALPCTLSLTLMTYHISLSQDGRSYSLLMFLGMTGLYFFLKHLKTSKNRYLILVALLFAVLFLTSYSSIPFIALSQILWFYRPSEGTQRPTLSSFLILNGLILLFCLPWALFVTGNYKGQPIMDPFHTESPGSFYFILYGVLHDWVLHAPLIIISIIFLILFPFFTKYKKNALILLTVFILPIGGLYLYCKLLNITHFITSRYFINFLPLFFITLFLSLDAMEVKFERLRRFLRLKLLFVILLIASNLIILPPYYRSEKQDFRGLVAFLKSHLQNGDKIIDWEMGYMPGILHYFGEYPNGRHQVISVRKNSTGGVEYRKSFFYRNKIFTIFHSEICCTQYVADGNRIWIVANKRSVKEIKNNSPSVLKGYFDGSFLNFNRFPTDASMYLFLWDPKSPEEKGIDMPIE
ncbi:MAG: glycosyltransferase family 39 protein [Thermodesulfobacteriota bacterium]|nr:glycosyltransferase family 39 protein [Thermodesulfobacteriota bacterium]